MLNTDKFIFLNKASYRQRRVVIEKGAIVFQSQVTEFSEDLLAQILKFSSQILEQKKYKCLPIYFEFVNQIKFTDKLMYVLFECICYELIQKGHFVQVRMAPICQIITHGYNSSPLLLLSTGRVDHVKKFKKKFEYEMYGRHFRKIIANNSKADCLSVLMDEIAIFQKPFDVREIDRERIAEVLTELVGNSLEHTNGDCLLDFDITDNYIKRGVDGKNYRGINIVILNFSDELLGTALQKKLTASEELPGRYGLVQKAYSTHISFFDDKYYEEDFYNIAAFQHKISGRSDNDITGGTGLTKLIQSLEEESDAYRCYVITGTRRLLFQHKYMGYNPSGWIGFNNANDFLGAPPQKKLLKNNAFFVPGTAYNLTFIMEVDKNE